MKRKEFIRPTSGMYGIKPYEGETIETKCARITQTKEPISDGAPIIYTEKKDGVRPEYDIRTDRWDIAQEAMDKVNAAKIAKGSQLQKPEQKKEQKTEQKTEQKPEQKTEQTA